MYGTMDLNNKKNSKSDIEVSNGHGGSRTAQESKMEVALVSGGAEANNSKILKHVKKKIPVVKWLPEYNLDSAVSDAIAGITVGLTVIPQGIAYAIVANLPPQYGLYSAFMGCFMYCIFGSVKDITIGPTAIMAIMTGDVFKEGQLKQFGPYYAVLLSFFSGIIIFVFGILQLGFLIDFISVPVISGFTSAAALTIASGQIKGLFGIYKKHHSNETHAGVVDDYVEIFDNLDTVRWQDAVLGIICAIILLSMRFLGRAKRFKPAADQSRAKYALNKAIWFVCTSRNAIIVIFCLVLAMIIDPDIDLCNKADRDNGNYSCTFMLTGDIDGGIPNFQLPFFSIPANATGSGEPEEDIGFGKMVQELGAAIIIIPIIAILESIAIAKAFSGGKTVDASQEMVALGICNLLGSFVQSMPTTGSFSRTAVNSSSGVKTPMGGLYTGALVILCLAFLMPYCAFIPKASLSAVIMTAVIFSVEYEVVLPIWSSKKIDLLPGFVCFFVGLFSELDYGIFAGVGLHVAIVLYQISRPKVVVEVRQTSTTNTAYLYISPDQAVIFPSATFIRAVISKAGERAGQGRLPVVLDCLHINNTDFTAARGFKAMLADFKSRQQEVFWLNTEPGVHSVLYSVAGEEFRTLTSPDDLDQPGSADQENSVPTYRNQDAELPV